MVTPGGFSLAILGTRGVPARYGGFETFAEQLATRLAGRGHRVTVYGRSRYTPAPLEGVESIVLPALYTKHLETASHTFLSTLHCMQRRPDVALMCNTANACFLPLLRANGIPTVLNVDGIEWQRRKWGCGARGVHLLAEHLAAAWADRMVADARFIARYYRERHGVASTQISYGGDLPAPTGRELLIELGLEEGGYDLCVCRFEPENRPLTVVQAHRRLQHPRPLVMVGGAPYARRYQEALRREAGPQVLFTGFRFGDEYRQLLFHARAFLYAGEVGGTHPVLLEAMGAGRLVLYHDTPENRETVGDAGIPFGPGGVDALQAVWEQLQSRPEWPHLFGTRARTRVQRYYRWDTITDAYEDLLLQIAGRRG
jgi:glycosyltransferase involved in cell wall biosynthesis